MNEFNGKPVVKVAESSFENVETLGLEFTFGDNIESIESYAFNYNHIHSITFGENSHLKTICDSAFFSVCDLSTFIAPKSLEKLDDLCFAYVPLTNVDFSQVDHVVTINGRPFFGNKKLSYMTIKVKNELLEEYKTKYTDYADKFIGVY